MADIKNPTSAALEPIHTEVLALVAQGMTDARIGRRLYLAEDSVNSRLVKCYRLLGVHTRAQAVAEAHRRGLLSRRPGLTQPPQQPLTTDQRDLLALVAQGLTYGEIGVRYSLTEATVKARVRRIRRIVGARDAAQLVHLAHVHGLLPAAPAAATYRVVFDRIGRNHSAPALETTAATLDELAERIGHHAVNWLGSREVEVHTSHTGGRIVVGGFRPAGDFTVQLVPAGGAESRGSADA